MADTARKTTVLLAGGAGGVPVEVERGRVRRLNLRLRADGSAHLSVPTRCTLAQAQRFLDAHEAWLRERLRRREERAVAAADGRAPLWGRLVELPAGTTPDELYRRELAARLPEVVDTLGRVSERRTIYLKFLAAPAANSMYLSTEAA